jgi:hypothetical protein
MFLVLSFFFQKFHSLHDLYIKANKIADICAYFEQESNSHLCIYWTKMASAIVVIGLNLILLVLFRLDSETKRGIEGIEGIGGTEWSICFLYAEEVSKHHLL